jgi:hypothetical protein
VHGPPWLENPTLSILSIAVGFYLLYRALQTEKHHRVHQQSEHGNIEREIFGHKIIDTNRGWILFTFSISLFAVGAHYLAENTFHVYDTTPVDRFTHGLSGMAIAAIVLNLYLTRRREYYYPMAISVSWIAFILWEVYELIYSIQRTYRFYSIGSLGPGNRFMGRYIGCFGNMFYLRRIYSPN